MLVVGRLVLLLMLFLASATTNAQMDIFALSLEELGQTRVKIATGTPRTLIDAPSVTSIITSHEIAALGATTLDQVLDTVPGLHVSRGSFQHAPRYFFRGIASVFNPQALVLIDGLPMTSLLLGDRGERLPNQHSIPVETIERIEIIRGPNSALYGADAFAGVINVITKGPDELDKTEIFGRYGSFNNGAASIQSAGVWRGIEGAVSIAYQESASDKDATIDSDLQSLVDSTANTNSSYAPSHTETGFKYYDLKAKLKWDTWKLALGKMRSWDTGSGQGYVESLDPGSEINHQRYSAELRWGPKQLPEDWILETRLAYLKHQMENPTGTQVLPEGSSFFGIVNFPDGIKNQPEYSEQNARFDLMAVYSGFNQHRLSLGTGYYWGDLYKVTDYNNFTVNPTLNIIVPRPNNQFETTSDSSEIFVQEVERTNKYLLFQDEWQISPSWVTTVGARYDHFSEVGSTVNPRLGLVWSTTDKLTTKLLYGEAFRPPSVSELYASVDVVIKGNDKLKPEKLKSTELAFHYQWSNSLSYDLNFYQFYIYDYIDFSYDFSLAALRGQNLGHFEGQGVEMELQYTITPHLNWLINYSYQNTEDRQTGDPLGYAPRDLAFSRLIWQLSPAIQFTPQINYVGTRHRGRLDTRDSLKGYTVFNLGLQYQLSPNAIIGFSARNLFDSDVREPSRSPTIEAAPIVAIENDLPQQGRFFSLGITLKL